jgi:GT2 family glycosyltransferase
MDISIIILTWNSEKHLSRCFDTLLFDLCSDRFSYEVFIVDNGSSDNTISIIKSFEVQYPNHIVPIYLNTNAGTTYSRNLALKQAKGDYVIIMDSDIEICQQRTIRRLLDTFYDKEIGLVAPKLVYPDGSLQKSTDDFPTLLTKIFRYFLLRWIEKREQILKQSSGLTEVDYAISALWVLKKEVLKNVGLLDENIFYAPEDVDYCLRIWLAGYKIVYNNEVSAIHHAQEISRGLKIDRAAINHIKGLVYYFKKHKYVFKKPNIREPF